VAIAGKKFKDLHLFQCPMAVACPDADTASVFFAPGGSRKGLPSKKYQYFQALDLVEDRVSFLLFFSVISSKTG
jgi:hypothetical protein